MYLNYLLFKSQQMPSTSLNMILKILKPKFKWSQYFFGHLEQLIKILKSDGLLTQKSTDGLQVCEPLKYIYMDCVWQEENINFVRCFLRLFLKYSKFGQNIFLTGAALEMVYLGNDDLHCNNLFYMCLLGIWTKRLSSGISHVVVTCIMCHILL